jgi:hypothetical protein
MFQRMLRPNSWLAPVLLLLATTSCMVTPGDGDNIGYIRDEPVQFSGFATAPGSLIRIEANHPERGWEPIRYTTSSSGSLVFDGITFFPWNTKTLIPLEYWSFPGEQDDAPGQVHGQAEVRAVDVKRNAPLYSFEGGYYEWFDFSQSLYGMWQEHGAGLSVTIFGFDVG